MTLPGHYPWAFRGVRSHRYPVFIRPAIQRFRNKFAAVVRLQPLWHPLLCLPYPFHHGDHIVTAKPTAYLDRHALTTKIIEYSQGAYPASVEQIISNEIHAPALVRSGNGRARMPVPGRHMPPRTFCPQVQPFQAINPMGFLVVNQPALAPQQDMDSLAPIAYPGLRYFPYPPGDGPVITAATVVVYRAALHHQPASPANPDAVRRQQILHRFALLHRSQNFFRITSCSISLSRLRSATSRFRR